jgi:chromosome segregation ATPase
MENNRARLRDLEWCLTYVFEHACVCCVTYLSAHLITQAADEAAVKAQHAADALKDSINNSPVRQEELKAAHDRAVKAVKDAEENARALKATALTQQNEYKAATEGLNKLTDELKPIADRLRKEYEEFKSAEANYNKEREDLLAATANFRKQQEEAEAAALTANVRSKFFSFHGHSPPFPAI